MNRDYHPHSGCTYKIKMYRGGFWNSVTSTISCESECYLFFSKGKKYRALKSSKILRSFFVSSNMLHILKLRSNLGNLLIFFYGSSSFICCLSFLSPFSSSRKFQKLVVICDIIKIFLSERENFQCENLAKRLNLVSWKEVNFVADFASGNKNKWENLLTFLYVCLYYQQKLSFFSQIHE